MCARMQRVLPQFHNVMLILRNTHVPCPLLSISMSKYTICHFVYLLPPVDIIIVLSIELLNNMAATESCSINI